MLFNLHCCLSFCKCFAAEVNYLRHEINVVSGNLSDDICEVNIGGNGSPVSVVKLGLELHVHRAGSQVHLHVIQLSVSTVVFLSQYTCSQDL